MALADLESASRTFLAADLLGHWSLLWSSPILWGSKADTVATSLLALVKSLSAAGELECKWLEAMGGPADPQKTVTAGISIEACYIAMISHKSQLMLCLRRLRRLRLFEWRL